MNRRSFFGLSLSSLFAPAIATEAPSIPPATPYGEAVGFARLTSTALPEWASGPRAANLFRHRARGYASPLRDMGRDPNIDAIRSYSTYYRSLRQAEVDIAFDNAEATLRKRIEDFAEKLGLRWDPYD